MELVHLSKEVILTISFNPGFDILQEHSLWDPAMNRAWLADGNDLLSSGAGGLRGLLRCSLLVLLCHD